MKKKSIFLAVLTTILTCAFSSCDEENATYTAPTFSGVEVEPNPCYEGDTITLTFTYSNRGSNWYYFKQNICVDGSSVFNATKSSSYYLADPPTATFVAPEAGTHTVSISGTLAPTAGATLYETFNEYTTSFEVSAKTSEE
jgi:hypothetical protein